MIDPKIGGKTDIDLTAEIGIRPEMEDPLAETNLPITLHQTNKPGGKIAVVSPEVDQATTATIVEETIREIADLHLQDQTGARAEIEAILHQPTQ